MPVFWAVHTKEHGRFSPAEHSRAPGREPDSATVHDSERLEERRRQEKGRGSSEPRGEIPVPFSGCVSFRFPGPLQSARQSLRGRGEDRGTRAARVSGQPATVTGPAERESARRSPRLHNGRRPEFAQRKKKGECQKWTAGRQAAECGRTY